MARHIATGIDIGTHHVRVVISERAHRSGKTYRRILGAGVSRSKGLRYGYIINPHEAARSIQDAVSRAESQADVKVRGANISLNGVSLESVTTTGSVVTSRADAEITERDVEQVLIEAERALSKEETPSNKRILHTVPLEYRIDGKEVLGRPVGMKGIKLEADVLLIVCLEQHHNDLVHAVESANIEVEDVIAAPIAAALINLTKTQKVAGVVLVNIGAETVSVVVYENNVPISLKIFPIGSTDITNDIALGLRVSLEEAENIKLEGDTKDAYPKKKLDDIITARLTDILELVQDHLKKMKKDGLLPAGIVLTGGGSNIASIEDLARASLKLPSQLASVEHTHPKGIIKDASWSVAYGLSVLGLQPQQITSSSKELVRRAGGTFKEWIRHILP